MGKKYLLGTIFTLFGVIIHGYVLSKLWSMLILPVFDLPKITLIQAAGLMLIIDFIFMKMDFNNKFEESEFKDFAATFIAHTTVTPFIVLFCGYIISLFY